MQPESTATAAASPAPAPTAFHITPVRHKEAKTTLAVNVWSNVWKLKPRVGEKDGPAFIAGVANGRADSTVSEMTALVGDFDGLTPAEYAAAEAQLTASGYEHYIYATFSDAPDARCARVIIPLAEPLPLGQGVDWKLTRRAMLESLGLFHDADPSCSNPGRIYFLPRHPEGETRAHVYTPGKPIDWRGFVSSESTAPAQVAARPVFGPASPAELEAARDALEAHGPAVEGHGGDLHTFQAMALIWNDYALPEDQGWSATLEWNSTCQPPWNETDLRAKIRSARSSASRPYGCKRKVDVLAQVRARCTDYRANPSEALALEIVKRARDLVASGRVDPLVREQVEAELLGSGVASGKRALALPPARVRAVQGTVVEQFKGLAVSATTGQPHANLANAYAIIGQQPAQAPFLELFSQTIAVPTETGLRPWTDGDDLALARHIQEVVGISLISPATVAAAVQSYAHDHARDCVLEAFRALEWDNVPRIETFLHRAFGAADNAYTRAVSKNMLRGMGARVLYAPCKVDNIVVLEGPQGKRKSSGLRELAGAEYFGESSASVDDKDFYMQQRGKLVVELGELGSLSRADTEAIKRMASCAVDEFRPPYGRAVQKFPRRGILVGTTNSDTWLRDETGNRRFWPVKCTEVDLGLIREEREQLFAEAVFDLEVLGEKWWDVPRELAEREQEARMHVHPWEEVLSAFLKGKSSTTAAECFERAIQKPLGQLGKGDQMQIAAILKRLGFKRGNSNGKRFWEREQ